MNNKKITALNIAVLNQYIIKYNGNYNTNNFYDAFIKQMDVALKQHFMRDKRGQLFVVAQTPEEINEQLNQR